MNKEQIGNFFIVDKQGFYYYSVDRFGKIDEIEACQGDVFLILERALVVRSRLNTDKANEWIVLSKNYGIKRIYENDLGILAKILNK